MSKSTNLFSSSWESLDQARNPGQYESREGAGGGSITCLKGEETMAGSQPQTRQFTEEELENIEKAAEQMNDRED